MSVEQTSMNQLITDNIDVWTSTVKAKSSSGRGSRKKRELYGVQKLRELILELAVRGKLTSWLEFRGSSETEMKKTVEEKELLAKVRKIRADKEVYSETSMNVFPASWQVVHIGQFAHVLGGKRVPKGCKLSEEATDFTYLRVTDMKNQSIDESDLRYISGEVFEQISRYVISMEDVYVTIAGTIGAVGTVPPHLDGASLTENAAKLVFRGISKEYLIIMLQSKFVQSQFGEAVNQMAQPKLSLSSIKQTLVSIPTLDEQVCIAEKVDELMTLCDQLEQQTEASIEAHQVLVTTLLDTLTNSADADELMQNWARISEHFDTLFTTEASIDQLKQTILQLAVMGKLVPQDPNDEPAEKLLERIAEEKAQLIKEKKIKKQKALPPITDDEKPFELPNGWEWCRFSDMSNEVATGPFGSMIHKRDYIEGGTPLINPSHMIDSKIIEDNSITVSDIKVSELSSYKLFENDIVMARRGEMGRCALVSKREEGWLCGTGSFVLRFNQSLSREYILLMFRTSYVREYLGGESIGTTMTNLNHGILNKMPLLLPPIEQQHRITTKVKEMVALCNKLKARLKESQTTQVQLTDAIVEQAV
ncbi:restriction endonuclease subunit S [Vibrio splendidus]|uniref:restriction endonuclease subunit S n=1 Tax=Vibrio splendidus TaxID=29497 RepID=UPI000CA83F39|nr:restriction endonuclease subunit S [Vibrio splendidus]PMJ80680.1 restriction endonuclease subunit S [Vibrio splendidus]